MWSCRSGGAKPKAAGSGIAALQANLAFNPAMMMGGPPPKLKRSNSTDASAEPAATADAAAGEHRCFAIPLHR
jgi:hypothetical protein